MILALVIFAPPISPSERFSFAKATVELITQPIILQESEILKAQVATADRLHMVVSLLEINRD